MSMEENGAARKWIYVGTGLVNGTFLIWNSAKSLWSRLDTPKFCKQCYHC